MKQANLNRVRDDLETIKQAAGINLRLRQHDVWMSLGVAAAGIPLALTTPWQPAGAWIASVWMEVALIAIPAALVFCLWARIDRACVRQSPNDVRATVFWDPRAAKSILPAALAAIAFFVAALATGVAFRAAVASAVFILGVGMLMLPILDRSRWIYFGQAIPTLLFGLAIPLWWQHYPTLVIGGWFILHGLSTAALIQWHLYRNGYEHATD